MKALSALVLVFITFSVWAGVGKGPDPIVRSSTDVNYVCTQYTVNQINPVTKQSTDNKPINRNNTVIETKHGFIVKSGSAFKEQVIVTNDLMGNTSGMAGNPNTLLLKKEYDGGAYFIIWTFEDSTGNEPDGTFKPGPNTGLVTLAGCSIK